MLCPTARRSLTCLSIAANVFCAGGVFTFPLLSPVLAQHAKLTQPQLTSIVLAGMAGQYPCTPLVGKIVDRQGPWLCSLIASLLFCVAFGCFAYETNHMLDAASAPSPSSVYFLVFLFALAGFATVFSYFSSLFAATRNFPEYPSVASGTVMALFGLSPLFLSFIAGFFSDSTNSSLDLVGFLAFLAILTGSVHLIGAINLRAPENHLPIPILFTQDQEADEAAPLLSSNRTVSGIVNDSVLDIIQDPHFWIFFLLLIVTLGPCEMVMSNVGTIVLSLPSVSATVSSENSNTASLLQVKILAISNTVTRLLAGPIADFLSPAPSSVSGTLPRKHYISRIVFLVGAAAVLGFTFLWMEFYVRAQADIWVLSVGTGIAYGAIFTVLPSVISSVWGARNVGRNFGIVVFAPLMGTSIFSYLYAFVSAYHGPSGGVCRGLSCWQSTFWIATGVQGAAIAWGLILWRGWKGLL
ncbi:MFS general substrate transporter [Mycena sp. CBHHK59/15]|nr:MFS general substrate transporter [Mycena sp. CBHHK59/15]